MARHCEFVHAFEDLSSDGMLSLDLDPPPGAVIRIDLEEGGKVWLSANRTGWLHLARICAELGLAEYEPGFHFHRDPRFADSDGSGPEVSFEIRGEEE
jgi:hypothetical protein